MSSNPYVLGTHNKKLVLCRDTSKQTEQTKHGKKNKHREIK